MPPRRAHDAPPLQDGRVRIVTHRDSGLRFLSRLEGTPRFACVIASTDTAEIPEISAAGATPEKRRYTAALDSELLLHGATLTCREIPKNPAGPPSPVVITRAGLRTLDQQAVIVDAGTRIPPRVPRLIVGDTPGNCDGLVKEGVGAGATAFAAFWSAGVGHDELVADIEEIVGGLRD